MSAPPILILFQKTRPTRDQRRSLSVIQPSPKLKAGEILTTVPATVILNRGLEEQFNPKT
ncbi:MAG: hypothetical protein ABSA75_01315 [Candidatus Bathyarchaeia archaeon]|jgi:hypothetical protein